MQRSRAFTLIELLIVVAIIAILAAIAVPNFLEAQTRSKVSRVRADQRSIATALEAYYVDYNKYPPDRNFTGPANLPAPFAQNWFVSTQGVLTTPIAYMSSLQIPDPFFTDDGTAAGDVGKAESYKFYNYGWDITSGPQNWGDAVRNAKPSGRDRDLPIAGYALTSYGPDRKYDAAEWVAWGLDSRVALGGSTITGVSRLYDPTNGTVSDGDLIRTGGGVPTPSY